MRVVQAGTWGLAHTFSPALSRRPQECLWKTIPAGMLTLIPAGMLTCELWPQEDAGGTAAQQRHAAACEVTARVH